MQVIAGVQGRCPGLGCAGPFGAKYRAEIKSIPDELLESRMILR